MIELDHRAAYGEQHTGMKLFHAIAEFFDRLTDPKPGRQFSKRLRRAI